MGKIERNYPTRYSLTPEERRELAEKFKRNRGASLTQIKKHANRLHVAQKPILQLIENLGLSVLPDRKPDTGIGKSRAHDAAEALFSRPKTLEVTEVVLAIEPAKPSPDTYSFDDLIELEADLRAEFEEKFAKRQKEQDEALELLSEMERTVGAARAEAAAAKEEAAVERSKAEQAMQQTSELRRKTRADREALDELQGNLRVVNNKYARIVGKARWLYAELREGMEREKALAEALTDAENAIASMRMGIAAE